MNMFETILCYIHQYQQAGTSVYNTQSPWGKYKWTSKKHMYVGVGNNLLVISNRGWK